MTYLNSISEQFSSVAEMRMREMRIIACVIFVSLWFLGYEAFSTKHFNWARNISLLNRFKIVCKAKKENNLFQRCRPCEHQHFIIIDKFFFSVQNSDVGSKKDTKGFFISNQIILMIATDIKERRKVGGREQKNLEQLRCWKSLGVKKLKIGVFHRFKHDFVVSLHQRVNKDILRNS